MGAVTASEATSEFSGVLTAVSHGQELDLEVRVLCRPWHCSLFGNILKFCADIAAKDRRLGVWQLQLTGKTVTVVRALLCPTCRFAWAIVRWQSCTLRDHT